MLEKPDVNDETLRACLRDQYGLHVTEIAFLPIGNDVDTAVYRVVADDVTPYFLKLRSWLRSGHFDATAVAIPRFLHEQGIAQIIAPITTRDGQLWARLDSFAVILFPFIAGHNGFAAPLSDRQWIDLGIALHRLHMMRVPPTLSTTIPQETYAPRWRDRVKTLQTRVDEEMFAEPIAVQMAAFLHAKREEISHMVARADALGDALRAQPPELVLCHADIHAANVLIGMDDAPYIVDWDTVTFAPKERDLIFIGGGVGGAWNSAREEALFYRGYSQTEINALALAYYRYEWIIEDIAEYGERLLLTDNAGADRTIGLSKFREQFGPNRVVEIAYRTDAVLRTKEDIR